MPRILHALHPCMLTREDEGKVKSRRMWNRLLRKPPAMVDHARIPALVRPEPRFLTRQPSAMMGRVNLCGNVFLRPSPKSVHISQIVDLSGQAASRERVICRAAAIRFCTLEVSVPATRVSSEGSAGAPQCTEQYLNHDKGTVMTGMSLRLARNSLIATAVFGIGFMIDAKPSTWVGGGPTVSQAEARIGRPATPRSYAGAARRTTRRAIRRY